MSAILRLTTGVVYVRSWSGTLSGGTLGVDTLQLDSTNLDVQLSRGAANQLDLATGDSLNLVNGDIVVNNLAVGVTTNPAITLQNTTAAALGAQQYSPGASLIGQGWSTDGAGASMPVEFRFEARPTQGAAAPTGILALMSRVAGGAWTDECTWNNISSGIMTLPQFGSIGFSSFALIKGIASGSIAFTDDSEVGFVRANWGAAGSATTRVVLQKKVTAIADNTATTVFTVTVPNANHACAVRLMFLSSNGSTDAFESSRCASGMIVLARTTGVLTVVTAATIDDAAIATVAAGATHTLAYSVSAVSGAVGDPNTFTIQVTIDDSGNLGSNQVVAIAELLNAEATGVTIA